MPAASPSQPQAGPSHARIPSGAARSSRSVQSVTSSAVHARPPQPLARRLLQRYPSTPLPPIVTTSSHDNAIPRLNEELYDFIALALRAYVGSWWSTRVSTRDRDFIPQISLVVTHVLGSLQQRIHAADISSLVLHGIPTLTAQHYRDYRAADAKLHTSYASDATLPHLFHYSQAHIAVSEDGSFNDTYLRQAIDHVLKACLPPSDWDSEMERAIVREIIVRPILGSVLPKLCQPWFLHNIALSLIGRPRPLEPPPPPPPPRQPLQFHDIIITFLTIIQTISTLCLQIIALVQASLHLYTTVNARTTPYAPPRKEENLIDPLVDLVAEVLTMRDRASSSALLSTVKVGTGFSIPFLDKLFLHLLYTHLLTPSRLTGIIISAKNLLFPNGYPGPAPIIPTPDEQVIIRDDLERRLLELIPGPILPYLAGPNPTTQRQTISAALDPLNWAECNAHLIMRVFDLVLITLFPEMGVGGEEDALLGIDGETESDKGKGRMDAKDEIAFMLGET